MVRGGMAVVGLRPSAGVLGRVVKCAGEEGRGWGLDWAMLDVR